jgi:hypothetical protein
MVETHYARSQPEEWTGLVTASAEQLVAFAGLTQDAAGNVYDCVNELDNERLEANYYYGLGSVMHGSARMLSNSALREMIIDEVVDSVVQYHFTKGTGAQNPKAGFDFFALEAPARSSILVDLSARSPRSPAERLLGDALEAATVTRRLTLSAENVSKDQHARDIDKIVGGLLLDRTIAESFFGAIDLVLAEALGVSQGNGPTIQTPIESFADEQKLRATAAGLIKPASRAAVTMRLDKFADPKVRLQVLTHDNEGKVTFHQDALPTLQPIPDEIWLVRHQAVLQCPAVAAHLVPIATRMVPETIIRAQAAVEAHHDSR